MSCVFVSSHGPQSPVLLWRAFEWTFLSFLFLLFFFSHFIFLCFFCVSVFMFAKLRLFINNEWYLFIVTSNHRRQGNLKVRWKYCRRYSRTTFWGDGWTKRGMVKNQARKSRIFHCLYFRLIQLHLLLTNINTTPSWNINPNLLKTNPFCFLEVIITPLWLDLQRLVCLNGELRLRVKSTLGLERFSLILFIHLLYSVLSTDGVIKLKALSWEGHITCMEGVFRAIFVSALINSTAFLNSSRTV